MNDVREEIKQFAADEDKEILLGLFTKYHWSSDWRFVANVRHKNYGKLSYETHRIWYPTNEGRILFKHLIQGT